MEQLSCDQKLVLSGAGISPRFRNEMLELCDAEKPNILIDFSAKTTQKKYENGRERMDRFFENSGVTVKRLQNSIHDTKTESERAELIDEADIFLVLGGSTRAAYQKWQKLNMSEQILKRVRGGEMVAAGTSAGAMIWFEKGYSDSQKAEVDEGEWWDYEVVESTGFIPAWITAHHSDIDEFNRSRSEGFTRTLEENTDQWELAIGIDVFAGLVCHDGLARSVDLRSKKSTESTHDIHLYYPDLPITGQLLPNGESVRL